MTTLMGCSAEKTIHPGARRRDSGLAASKTDGQAPRWVRLAPVDALQLGLGLLHGARGVTGLDRLRERIDDDVAALFRRLLIRGPAYPLLRL